METDIEGLWICGDAGFARLGQSGQNSCGAPFGGTRPEELCTGDVGLLDPRGGRSIHPHLGDSNDEAMAEGLNSQVKAGCIRDPAMAPKAVGPQSAVSRSPSPRTGDGAVAVMRHAGDVVAGALSGPQTHADGVE